MTLYSPITKTLLVGALALAACAPAATPTPATEQPTAAADASTQAPPTEAVAAPADDRADWPTTFRVGMFGGDDAEAVLRDNEPFRAYLEAELGMPVELSTGTSYSAVIEAMRAERVDGMLVGPFAYVLAVQEADAEALAVSINTRAEPAVYDPDALTHYLSVIFTKKGSGIRTVQDLVGKDFAFVDPASTSGHLAPKTFLIDNGIDPDSQMSTVFAGSHQTSVLSVWGDTTPAGATFEGNLYDLAAEGQVEFCGFPDGAMGVTRTQEEIMAVYDACPDGSLVIIAQTDPIPSTPFAVRTNLPDSFKAEVKRLLLEIQNMPDMIAQTRSWYVDPHEALGLESLDQYYNSLRDIARLLDLDLRELAN